VYSLQLRKILSMLIGIRSLPLLRSSLVRSFLCGYKHFFYIGEIYPIHLLHKIEEKNHDMHGA